MLTVINDGFNRIEKKAVAITFSATWSHWNRRRPVGPGAFSRCQQQAWLPAYNHTCWGRIGKKLSQHRFIEIFCPGNLYSIMPSPPDIAASKSYGKFLRGWSCASTTLKLSMNWFSGRPTLFWSFALWNWSFPWVVLSVKVSRNLRHLPCWHKVQYLWRGIGLPNI